MMVPPRTSDYATPRSKALAKELRRTLDDFRAREPKTSGEEVRAALASVTPDTWYTPARRVAIAVTVALCVAVFALVASTAEGRQRGRPTPWVPIAAVLAAGVAAVAAAWMRTRDD